MIVRLSVKPGARPVTVEAVAALGGLALHRDPWNRTAWAITHLASGQRALESQSRLAGLRGLAVLNQPGVDWRRRDIPIQAPQAYARAHARAKAAVEALGEEAW